MNNLNKFLSIIILVAAPLGAQIPIGSIGGGGGGGGIVTFSSTGSQVGPPTSTCIPGITLSQTDAVGPPVWTCQDSYTWVNIPTGQLSFVSQTCHYWVDSINGLDTNNGKAAATAFQTITKLNTVTFVTNDSVCLAANSHWQNQQFLPNSVSGLQVYAYGVGSLPVIDASAVAANASFTLTGGCSATYQITVTPNFSNVAGADFVNVWENDVAFARQALSGGCLDTAPAGAYFPSSDGSGSGPTAITLYIHASDASDVVTNANIYEYASYDYGLNMVGITHAVVANICTKKNLSIDGSAWFGRYFKGYNLQVWDGSKHSIYWQDGGICTGCFANRAYYNSAIDMFIISESSPIGLGATCINCSAELPIYEQVGGTAAVQSLTAGWGLHAVVSGNFGVVNIINFSAKGVGVAVSTSDASITNLTNISCVGCLQGVQPGSSSNGSYTGGVTNINGLYVPSGNYAIQPNASGTVTTARNIHFSSTNASSALYYAPTSLSSATLNLYNSAIDSGAPWYCVEGVSTTFNLNLGNSAGTANNCGKATISYIKTSTLGTVVMDYNSYYPPGGSANWIINGTTYTTWAALQGAGFETHGTQP